MTIFNADWRREATGYVLPRLYVAHPDLSRMAAALRNTAVDIWTESPSDPARLTAGRSHFSLEGWRSHYKAEYAKLNQWNTTHGVKLDGYDSQAKVALDGYLASLPAIAQAFNAVTSQYEDAQGRLLQAKLTQAERDSIATAIEAELQ